MSHWAEIDETNTVLRVVVGDEREPEEMVQWLTDNLGGTWLQTSYNTSNGVHYTADREPSDDQSKAFRKNYAGIGYIYDEALDAFIPPMPTEGEWVLDEDTCLWVEVAE
jgi:hypothetical protein